MSNREKALVYVVDDDDAIREALDDLFCSAGLRAQAFSCSSEFLAFEREDVASCLVLDVRLPDVNGLDFQMQLRGEGIDIPIIFITGHGDIPMSVKAIKAGALEFLTKPFRDQDLLEAVRVALADDAARRAERLANAGLLRRYETLTPREKEVMALLVEGQLNKQISMAIGATESTVKTHRTRIMQKMQAGSVAELVRMADVLSGL